MCSRLIPLSLLVCLIALAACQSSQARHGKQEAELRERVRAMYAAFGDAQTLAELRATADRILALTPDSRVANEIMIALKPGKDSLAALTAQSHISALATDVVNGEIDPLETIDEHQRRVYAHEFEKLTSQRLTMHLDRVTLQEAIRQFAVQSGCNLFVNWPAMGWAGVDLDMPISLHVEDMPAEQVLDNLLRIATPVGKHGIVSHFMMDGIIIVSTSDDMANQRDNLLSPPTVLD